MKVGCQRPEARGQVAWVLVLMLAGICFLLMLVFDVFLSARAKEHLINTGDAAALACARAQMDVLNRLGELNIEHLRIACDEAIPREERERRLADIAREQERVAFLGPIEGLISANDLARRNISENRSDGLAPIATDMASIVYEEMAAVQENRDFFVTESWPEKADEYLAALSRLLSSGLVCGVDNARLLSANITGGHLYYTRGFYEAVTADNPRWFCRYCGYQHADAVSMCASFRRPNPDEITSRDGLSSVNPGFLSVGATRLVGLRTAFSASALFQLWNKVAGGYPIVSEAIVESSNLLDDARFPWYVFDTSSETGLWRQWKELHVEDGRNPLTGDLREEYDIYGAIASVRVESLIPPASSPAVTNEFVWRSAAKPFGMYDGRVVTDQGGNLSDEGYPLALILPVFTDVRLIPFAGIPASDRNKADAEWLRHCRHVAANNRDPDCRYCRIIIAWEKGGAAAMAAKLQAIEHSAPDGCLPSGTGGTMYDDNADNF